MKTKTLKLFTFLIFSQFICIQLYAQCVSCTGGSATGTTSSIIGLNNTASGNYSFAGGKDSRALGQSSFAFGDIAYADSPFSIAIGKEIQAFGGTSVAIGRFLKTTISSSMVIGYGLNSTSTYLVNDKEFSMMMGFNSNVPTFFVSSSNGIGTTGRIGIGNVTNPTAKLHIKADANEDASLKLDASGTGKFGIIYFTADHTIKAKSSDNFTFRTLTGKSFVFENGNMGIGTSTPTEKLEVTGNIKQTSGYNLFTSTVKAPDANGLKLFNNSGNGIYITNTGNVGIGTTSTLDYQLAVAGKILATEVMIKHIDNWYDHVFNDDYKLISLPDLEDYIVNNNRLPDIPSEEEVIKDGLQMGNIAGLLLKKIEELTLYTIQQQKLIEQQQEIINKILENKEIMKLMSNDDAMIKNN